jgi:Domain of unknown function (DUF4276)
MSDVILGFYAEGSTDYDFLPPVIRRTTEQVLVQHDRNEMDATVLVIQLTKGQEEERAESIFQAARNAYGYHALVVHADADDPRPDKAKAERIEPGFKRVQEAKEEVCKNLVPIIPVQAIEAWILADYQLLLAEIGTKMKADELGIPTKAGQVESISKPKRRLEDTVRKAYASRSKRQRKADIDFLYEPMGEKIRLERLKELSSYLQFVDDLTETLKELNIIPHTNRF